MTTSLTLVQARDAIRARKISPLELTQAYLARIEKLNPQLNAFLQVAAETALADARAATDAVTRGDNLGALHGIPIAIKDLFDVRGLRTTAASILLKDNVAQEDAFVTRKLRAAGAIILGKTNLHEWALGVTSVSPHFGACHNPWNIECITGGSSGGSAAAVAARLCAGALGSDTGGSIRIPASLCGVVGLKPTYGRVSLHGAVPLAWSLDHAGPMTRTVEDTAILLQAIAGYDAEDPASEEKEAISNWGLGIRNLPFKVGVPDQSFFANLHPETESAIRAAIMAIKDLGYEIREVALDGHEAASQAAVQILVAEAAAFHRERIRDHADAIGADVLTRLKRGTEITGQEFALARRTQVEWKRKFARLFETIDALVLPATPNPAMRIADSDGLAAAGFLARFTRLFNLTGLPTLVLPCGFTKDGLPIGLQIVGPAWGEAKVLQLGHAYESATEWHKREPPF